MAEDSAGHDVDEAYRLAMSETVDSIVAEAVQLPPEQRFTVAHRILSSVEPERTAGTDAAWDQEIRRRIALYDAGNVRTTPAPEVFAELDRRLNS